MTFIIFSIFMRCFKTIFTLWSSHFHHPLANLVTGTFDSAVWYLCLLL